MVECHLAKVDVAGSNPVSRSKFGPWPPPHRPSKPLLLLQPETETDAMAYRASKAPLWCRSCSFPAMTSIAITSKRVGDSLNPCFAA